MACRNCSNFDMAPGPISGDIKTLSHVKARSFSADGIGPTHEIPLVKRGWSVIRRAQLRQSEKAMQLQGSHLRGRF